MIIARPLLSTNVAEFVAASTGHMVTTLTPLDHIFAVRTLAVVEIILKKLHLIFLTGTIMDGKETFLAESLMTFVASYWLAIFCQL